MNFHPQYPSKEELKSVSALLLVDEKAIRNKIANMRTKWRDALNLKLEGHPQTTGQGLDDPGDVAAEREKACPGFKMAHDFFSRRNVSVLTGTVYNLSEEEEEDTAIAEDPVPKKRRTEPVPSSSGITPRRPKASSQRYSMLFPEEDEVLEATGDENTPDLSSSRRPMKAPPTVAATFVRAETAMLNMLLVQEQENVVRAEDRAEDRRQRGLELAKQVEKAKLDREHEMAMAIRKEEFELRRMEKEYELKRRDREHELEMSRKKDP